MSQRTEEILKRKEEYASKYSKEIEALDIIIKNNDKNDFIISMYNVLISGDRQFTQKMHNAVLNIMSDPRYDIVKQIKIKHEIQPIVEKIKKIYEIVEYVDKNKSSYYKAQYSALPFIKDVKEYVETRYKITKNQMEGMNKVYRKYKKQYSKMKEKGEQTNE
jgi:hypothetical protein|tara:strand:+ start:7982 stop:8467 length:486 start_codon:yes stop_codon:yes gene_type:complete